MCWMMGDYDWKCLMYVLVILFAKKINMVLNLLKKTLWILASVMGPLWAGQLVIKELQETQVIAWAEIFIEAWPKRIEQRNTSEVSVVPTQFWRVLSLQGIFAVLVTVTTDIA